jgi:hypothetical protein
LADAADAALPLPAWAQATAARAPPRRAGSHLVWTVTPHSLAGWPPPASGPWAFKLALLERDYRQLRCPLFKLRVGL